MRLTQLGMAMALMKVIPLVPGFLVNATFFAMVAASIFSGASAARRIRRVRRGECGTCGYPPP